MSLKFLADRGGLYIYPWYISDITATADVKKLVGKNVKKTFQHIKKDFQSFFYDEESTNEIGKLILDKIIQDKSYYKNFSREIYRLSAEMESFCKKIDRADVAGSSDSRLLAIYSEYIKRMRELRNWGWLPNFIDGLFVNFLTDLILKKMKEFLASIRQEKKLSDYYSTLSSSEKMSEVQSEELARLSLLLGFIRDKGNKKIIALIRSHQIEKIGQDHPEIYRSLRKHLKDFGWLTYAYSGPVMSMDHLLQAMQDSLSKGDIAGQIKRIKDYYRNISRDKAAIIKRIKLTPSLVYLFKVSAEMMYMKDFRKGSYQKSYVAMDKVIGEIARRLDMTAKEAKYLLFDEIKAALIKGRKNFFRNLARKRMKECGYVTVNGKIKVHTGSVAAKLFRQFKKDSEKGMVKFANIKELKGKTAYKGKVQGFAKILLSAQDLDKVKAGDILVSSSTNPDLIVAMKKAAAFVTDLGGITSHAAIVSREMKKPCVVGTVYATHALQDGDLVEVDANAGVVRILKRAAKN